MDDFDVLDVRLVIEHVREHGFDEADDLVGEALHVVSRFEADGVARVKRIGLLEGLVS